MAITLDAMVLSGLKNANAKRRVVWTQRWGAPSPRSSQRWNFEISATGALTRHGVINWEEFGEKFWWVVLHSTWSTKMPRKFRPKFRPIFRPILRPEFRPVVKICRRNFALGNVRRNKWPKRKPWPRGKSLNRKTWSQCVFWTLAFSNARP